jgi:predicted phage terminase large subunit-like protein
VISLPAIAEENDPVGRLPGQALCPERFPLATLDGIRRVLLRDFSALYQQNPVPREGAMFHADWFGVPVEAYPAGCKFARAWDKAATEGSGDYTAGVLIGVYANIYYIVDVIYGQWSLAARERMIRQTAELDKQKYGEVDIWIEQEGGSGGKDSTKSTVSNLAGFSVYTEHPTGDKETRAKPLASQAEALNVKLLKGTWNAVYIDQLCSFPDGAHDDLVDASSMAFNKLAAMGPSAQEWIDAIEKRFIKPPDTFPEPKTEEDKQLELQAATLDANEINRAAYAQLKARMRR